MSGLFSAPKPTSPKVIAEQQRRVNADQAKLGEQYNRIDQYGPFGGSVTYDPATRAQTTALGQPGQEMAGNLQDASNQYFQTAMQGPGDSTAAWNRAFGMAREFTDPLFADQIAAQETQLRNQGLVPGSKAYDSAMQSLRRSQGDQYNRAAFGLQNQAFIQGQDQFRNSLAALAPGYQLGGPAFLSPQVSPFAQVGTGQTPNMAAITKNYDDQRRDLYSGLMSGVGGLAGLGLKAFGGGLF